MLFGPPNLNLLQSFWLAFVDVHCHLHMKQPGFSPNWFPRCSNRKTQISLICSIRPTLVLGPITIVSKSATHFEPSSHSRSFNELTNCSWAALGKRLPSTSTASKTTLG